MKLGCKTTWVTAIALVVSSGITGCDWQSTDEDSYWSDRYNWVDFSGVYKNPNGGSVVTDFSFTTPDSAPVSVGPVVVATGTGGNVYSGTLLPNVVPRSVQINAGSVVFRDDGNGNLVPQPASPSVRGSISYISGAWEIYLGGLTVPSGQPIHARYSALPSAGNMGQTTTGGLSNKGTTKHAIYSFVVFQEGNQLRFLDSDGCEYLGKFGSLRTVSGELYQDSRGGDTVVGQFSVKGVSKAGYQVEITGVLQGTIFFTADNRHYVLGQRRIEGNWIEKNGKVGDVYGKAKDIWIYLPTQDADKYYWPWDKPEPEKEKKQDNKTAETS